MLAVAAAFVLFLLLLQGLRGPEQASAQASKSKKNDIGELVASGDDVKGESATKPAKKQGSAAMPQTGSRLEEPLLLGLVLLLDGALAFLVTSRRRTQVPSPT